MWLVGTPSDGMCYQKRNTAQSSRRATYIICRHTCYTISQRPFGHITLVGYIPLKYYIYVHLEISVVFATIVMVFYKNVDKI